MKDKIDYLSLGIITASIFIIAMCQLFNTVNDDRYISVLQLLERHSSQTRI